MLDFAFLDDTLAFKARVKFNLLCVAWLDGAT